MGDFSVNGWLTPDQATAVGAEQAADLFVSCDYEACDWFYDFTGGTAYLGLVLEVSERHQRESHE